MYKTWFVMDWKMGLSSKIVNNIKYLCENANFKVEMNNTLSDNVSQGVFQGESLSRLLFNLFISTLYYSLKRLRIYVWGREIYLLSLLCWSNYAFCGLLYSSPKIATCQVDFKNNSLKVNLKKQYKGTGFSIIQKYENNKRNCICQLVRIPERTI